MEIKKLKLVSLRAGQVQLIFMHFDVTLVAPTKTTSADVLDSDIAQPMGSGEMAQPIGFDLSTNVDRMAIHRTNTYSINQPITSITLNQRKY